MQSIFRTGLLRLAFSSARMSVLMSGFQSVFGFRTTFGKVPVAQNMPLLWRVSRKQIKSTLLISNLFIVCACSERRSQSSS